MKKILILVFLSICGISFGQTCQIDGKIIDETTQPLPSATIVLMNPVDSTLMYFGVAGNTGMFEIKNIKKGKYIIQASLVGHTTYHKAIMLPSETGDDLGTIVLPVKTYNIGEVTVSGERIPMKIKQDTIEYDARAYKVTPDAVAEDLIKKLPGIEVDRSGNIKAMGEDVKKVLVDGKEFFSNDPKLATRNLPADAVAKVQLYDKQSDESGFTGIDDGERDPTINIVLEANKRKGIFGEGSVGGGTNDHFSTSAKLYRFTNKTQLAALGMYNNINQFGFTVRDFISPDAGGPGGGNNSSSFGQQVSGIGSNGAAGLNFSVFNSNRDRFFISYIGSGSKRNIGETSKTWNYVSDRNYFVDKSQEQVKRDTSHSLTLGLRKQIGENSNIIANGSLSYDNAANPLNSLSESYLNDELVNNLSRSTKETKAGLSGNADLSFLQKVNGGNTILRISGKTSYSGSNSKSDLLNNLEYENPYRSEITNQFYNVDSETGSYSGGLSVIQKVNDLSSLALSVDAGLSTDDLDRSQGNISDQRLPDEDLSPELLKKDKSVTPGLTWKRTTTTSKLTVSLNSTFGEFSSRLNKDEGKSEKYSYLTPRVRWEYDYKSGRRLMLDFASSVNTPQASQLLPVVNNENSLSLFYGNRNLHPEYSHAAKATWWIFDQFSFTTLLAGMNVTYTHNKIGYVMSVDSLLRQKSTLANFDNNWDAGGNLNFSTPIKNIGLKVNINLSESYDRGQSIINNVENTCTSFNHRLTLSFDNRKKDKWDAETGGTISVTNSKYSIQSSLNNSYYDLSWFGELRYSPNSHFSFMTSADITNYSAKNFDESELVPLLGSEISYYFLKNQRASFTLAGVDLLNRDTGIKRTSEMNYLSETRSNVIGRYVLLSFKYRINKMGGAQGSRASFMRG